MRFLLFSFLLLPAILQAQVPDRMDILYLEGGSTLKGQILEWSGDSLTIRLAEGLEMRIATRSVARVEHKADVKSLRIKNERRSSAYATAGLGLAINSQRTSLMLDASGGYRFNPRLALGLGAGVSQYDFNGEVFYPLFMEWRALWSERVRSPYTVLRGGVTAVSWDGGDGFFGTQELRDYSTPLMLQFALGWRFWQGEKAHLAGEIGYLHQRSDYRYTIFFDNDTQEGEVTRTFRHFTLRVLVGF